MAGRQASNVRRPSPRVRGPGRPAGWPPGWPAWTRRTCRDLRRPERPQFAGGLVAAMRYRLEVRLCTPDVGQRVVLRWRRPARDGGEEVADVRGLLEAADAGSFTVRVASGELVVIPRALALAGKTVPPAPRRQARARSGSL